MGLIAVAALVFAAAAGAAGPPNDNRSNAQPLGPLPAKATGTTAGSTREPDDPISPCGRDRGNVWYRFDAEAADRLVLRLKAGGDLDAVVTVYRRVRSQLRYVACDPTNDKGIARLSFSTEAGGIYLIAVGQRIGSAAGTFRLDLFVPEPPATPPGTALPPQGVRDSVDALVDPDDSWATTLRAGTTYRLKLTAATGSCLDVALYPPGTRSFNDVEPVLGLPCIGYATFTPGPDGGGRYSILVSAEEGVVGRQAYRLKVAKATPDDTAPGIPLTNGQTRRGQVSARTVDVVDLYRFGVGSRSDLTLTLRTGAAARMDLVLLTDSGHRLRCDCYETGGERLRIRLNPGRYYAVVRAREGSGGRYRLSMLLREITSTDLLISGSHDTVAAPGQAVTLSENVSTAAAAGGLIRVQVDRFDPLSGWQFFRLFGLRAGGDGSATATWIPPTVGRWRAHAVFYGTRTASPSESGYARLLVAEALPPR